MSAADTSQPARGHAPSAREAATTVARELARAGHVAYFAGGCVRDGLLGDEPEDYDIATDARPEQVKAIFRRARGVGESFGVMLVRLMGHTIQVATFRTDGVYSDGRHPDNVTFSDAEHDARRRDFTINGLFENPLVEPPDDPIIDFVGGRADLEMGVVRAIGDPAARLREDRLRMLRAVRFAARFDFRLDPATARAIRAGAGQLEGVSRERIGHEVRKMMVHPRRAAAARMMQDLGLDGIVLDEPGRTGPLAHLEGMIGEVSTAAALASWLLDRHEQAGDDLDPVARRWGRALLLSNDEQDELRSGLRVLGRLVREWPELGVAARKRLAASTWFDLGLRLLRSVDAAAAGRIDAQLDDLESTGLAPTPLIDGEDLIAAGLAPGPAFKRLLDAAYDAQLEGRVSTREEALEYALATATDESTAMDANESAGGAGDSPS